jgi:hypothetical protein
VEGFEFLQHDASTDQLVPDECALGIDEPMDWAWREFMSDRKVVVMDHVHGRIG